MKRTLRNNALGLPYSLHDMRVTELAVNENDVTFKFADGFEQNIVNGKRVKGEICFHNVDWDFCFAYVLDFYGNAGNFTGSKKFLIDFVKENGTLLLEIIDETYGYNSSKFAGWLWIDKAPKECVIELYHIGSMEYITEE